MSNLAPIIPRRDFIRPATMLVNSIVLNGNICIKPGTDLHNSFNHVIIGSNTGVRSGYIVRNFPRRSAIIRRSKRVNRDTVLRNYVVHHGTLIKVGTMIVSNTIVNRGDVINTSTFIGTGTRVPTGCLVINDPTGTVHRLDRRRLT